jgi:hypothetical protein
VTHRRQRRKTWILVGVVFVLGAAAVAEQVRERMLVPKPLYAAPERELRTIVLDCEGCTRRRLVRLRGAWELAEPYVLPVAPERIDEIMTILRAPVRNRHAAAEFDAKKIGLAPPYAVLQADQRTFEYGTTDALHHDRYVRIGDQVALVADRFPQILKSTPEALVDPRPFAGLERLKTIRVDDVALPAATVETLKSARAQQVLPSAAGAMGARIVAEFGTNRSAAFTLVAGEEGTMQLVREEPVVVYVLDAATAKLLAPAVTPPPPPAAAVPETAPDPADL